MLYLKTSLMRADFHRHFVERSYCSEVLSVLLFLVTVPEVLMKVTLAQSFSHFSSGESTKFMPRLCGEKVSLERGSTSQLIQIVYNNSVKRVDPFARANRAQARSDCLALIK